MKKRKKKVWITCWNCDNFNINDALDECKVYGKFEAQPKTDECKCKGKNWECNICGYTGNRVQYFAYGLIVGLLFAVLFLFVWC